jgi:hypothetical protein
MKEKKIIEKRNNNNFIMGSLHSTPTHISTRKSTQQKEADPAWPFPV